MALEMLIAAVAEHPVPYDLTLFPYRDQLKTANEWKKVAPVIYKCHLLLSVRMVKREATEANFLSLSMY